MVLLAWPGPSILPSNQLQLLSQASFSKSWEVKALEGREGSCFVSVAAGEWEGAYEHLRNE